MDRKRSRCRKVRTTATSPKSTGASPLSWLATSRAAGFINVCSLNIWHLARPGIGQKVGFVATGNHLLAILSYPTDKSVIPAGKRIHIVIQSVWSHETLGPIKPAVILSVPIRSPELHNRSGIDILEVTPTSIARCVGFDTSITGLSGEIAIPDPVLTMKGKFRGKALNPDFFDRRGRKIGDPNRCCRTDEFEEPGFVQCCCRDSDLTTHDTHPTWR